MGDKNETSLNILEKALSSKVFERNAKILFFAWTIITIFILFFVRVNENNSEALLYEFAYPVIGAMVLIMISYEFGRRKYARNYSIFRYRVRDRLKGTEFEEKSHKALLWLIPTFKADFFVKYLGFVITGIVFYSSVFVLESILRWISVLIGIIILLIYNQYLNQISTEEVIKSSQLV